MKTAALLGGQRKRRRNRVRALGVARVSTEEQADEDRYSIPFQRQRITDYCMERGWELLDVVEYVQSGGRNWNELQALLQRVQQDRIDVIIVNELDRLTRDLRTTIVFLDDLNEFNVQFVSISDDLDLTTSEGRLKMMILSVFAHYFREQLARKIRGGLRQRAKTGRHHGGRLPYGYAWGPDGRYAPDPLQAPVVRRMFDWYIREGVGTREIAKRLNAEGIPTQTGRSVWQAPDIRRMLSRPVYVGDLLHGAIAFRTDRTGVSHRIAGDDPIAIQDAQPALVDRDTWNAAQRIRAARGQGSGRQADSPYLLSGLVFCGLCGRTLVPVKGGRPGKRTRYVCRGYQAAGTCTARHAVYVDELEQAVTGRLLRELEEPSPDTVMAWVDQMEGGARARDTLAAERQRIERRLAEIPQMRRRAEDALVQGVWDVMRFRTVDQRIRDDEARLRARLAEVAPLSPLPPTQEEARRIGRELRNMAEQFRHLGTVHQRRQIVGRFIARIEVGEDKAVTIFFREAGTGEGESEDGGRPNKKRLPAQGQRRSSKKA